MGARSCLITPIKFFNRGDFSWLWWREGPRSDRCLPSPFAPNPCNFACCRQWACAKWLSFVSTFLTQSPPHAHIHARMKIHKRHSQFNCIHCYPVLLGVTTPVSPSSGRTDGVLGRKQLPLQLQEVLIKCAEKRCDVSVCSPNCF